MHPSACCQAWRGRGSPWSCAHRWLCARLCRGKFHRPTRGRERTRGWGGAQRDHRSHLWESSNRIRSWFHRPTIHAAVTGASHDIDPPVPPRSMKGSTSAHVVMSLKGRRLRVFALTRQRCALNGSRIWPFNCHRFAVEFLLMDTITHSDQLTPVSNHLR